jgi:putative FmdB family regulatory protein
MPLYEYYCLDCESSFEELQPIDDEPKTICIRCSGNQIKRLISKTFFTLKGPGWSADLYTKPVRSNGTKNE